MLSSGQKQCQRQKEAVGGLDSASPGYWGSYLPATGLILLKAVTHLQPRCKGCQHFFCLYISKVGVLRSRSYGLSLPSGHCL